MKTVLKLCIIAFFLLAVQTGFAYDESLDFAEIQKVGDVALPLKGSGLKKFLNIHIVAVGLYAPRNVEDVLSDCPKRLEVVYLQDIAKAELVQATIKGIRLNTSHSEFESLQDEIMEINAKYTDVRKGDKITMNYVPQKGLQVMINDADKGVVPGPQIARAFFAIWVGDRPVDAYIKNRLLGIKKTDGSGPLRNGILGRDKRSKI